MNRSFAYCYIAIGIIFAFLVFIFVAAYIEFKEKQGSTESVLIERGEIVTYSNKAAFFDLLPGLKTWDS